jgi:circadian clock protein KaiC
VVLAGSPLAYRCQLLALKEFFAEQHAIVVLLDDRSSTFGSIQP